MKKFFKKLAGVMTVVAVGAITGCDCGNSKHIVTFDYGLGGGDSTIQIDGGNLVTKPNDPSRDGYLFAGWFEDSEFTRPFDFTKSVNRDTTIYAKWVKVGYLTLPNKDLLLDGYSLTMPEGQEELMYVGDEAIIYLTLHKDYISDSLPKLYVNNVELKVDSYEMVGTTKRYSYKYICDGSNAQVSVDGINIEKYSITLPSDIEGARIVSVSGYDATSINKYGNYKFRLVALPGYSISNAVVTVNGNEAVAVDGVYTITDIVNFDTFISVDGVFKERYSITYYEDELALANGTASSYFRLEGKQTSLPTAIEYGNTLEFYITITDAKYSNMINNIAEYIDVLVDEYEVPFEVNGNVVSIDSSYITGKVDIKIRVSDFEINESVVFVPTTSLSEHGYEMYVDGYTIAGSDTYIKVTDMAMLNHIPYNSTISVGLRIDDEYKSAVSNVKNLAIVKLDNNGTYSKAYTTDSLITFNIKSDTTLSVDATFKITRTWATGVDHSSVQYQVLDGYNESKAYCFKTGDLQAMTYKFRLMLDRDGYDHSNMTVSYYTTDPTNLQTIYTMKVEDLDKDYIDLELAEVTKDTTIVIQNVSKEQYTFAIPSTATGISSIKFSGTNDTSKVLTHFDQVDIVLEVAESHNYYTNNIMLNLGKYADVTKISNDSGVITFRITNIRGNISASDVVVEGALINMYDIVLPKPSERVNYSLLDAKGDIIGSADLRVNYGDTVILKIVADDEYTKDADYKIIINRGLSDEQEIIVTSDDVLDGVYELELSYIINNYTVEIEGIDTVNTYTVTYYDIDKTTILTSVSNIEHNSALQLIDYDGDMDKYYHFAGWHYMNASEIGDEAKDNDAIVKDIKIVAVKETDKFYVTYENINGVDGVYNKAEFFGNENFANIYVNEETGKVENNATNNAFQYTVEDVNDSLITFENITLEKGEDVYVFDYFVLSKDIATKVSETYPLGVIPIGTIVNGIGVKANEAEEIVTVLKIGSMEVECSGLVNVALKPSWKITVGHSGKFRSLSDAIDAASYTEVDKIEILSNLYNETERIVIDKSIYITTSENFSKAYTELLNYSANVIDGKYQAMFHIEGFNGSIIDVTIENLNIEYSCSNATYQAYAIYSKNANLTLNNVGVDTQSNGVYFSGSKHILQEENIVEGTPEITINNSLNINGGKILCSQPQETTMDRDCGLYIDALNADVLINICDTQFSTNGRVDEFKGIYVANNGCAPTINLDGVQFVGTRGIDEPNGKAIVLDVDANLTITNVAVNLENTCEWSHLLVKNYAYDLSSEADKQAVLNSEKDYAISISSEYVHNCIVLTTNYLDYDSNMIFENILSDSLIDNDPAIRSSLIKFSNVSQLSAYVSYGANMQYTNKSMLELTSNLSITNNEQIIDLNGASLILKFSLSNKGILTNVGNINLYEGNIISNDGNIMSSGNIIQNGNITNGVTASISARMLTISDSIILANSGYMSLASVINNGLIVNNGTFEVVKEEGSAVATGALTNNGNITNSTTGSVEIDGALTNAGSIVNQGEVVCNSNFINLTDASITNAEGASVTLQSHMYSNLGSITNDGDIVDTSTGLIVAGTINDYGVNADVVVEETQYSYRVDGTIGKAQDESAVAGLYPSGTGYYFAVTIYTGINNAGKTITINLSREDNPNPYSYYTRTVTDVADELGRIEIIIDSNVVNGEKMLYGIEIKLDLDSAVDSDEDGTLDNDEDLRYFLVDYTTLQPEAN